jgi:hypothetical protein
VSKKSRRLGQDKSAIDFKVFAVTLEAMMRVNMRLGQ